MLRSSLPVICSFLALAYAQAEGGNAAKKPKFTIASNDAEVKKFRDASTISTFRTSEALGGKKVQPYFCALSREEPKMPFPLLSFCHRTNMNQCCKPVHDDIIKENFYSVMPEGCHNPRRWTWEQLHCLGCHWAEPRVVDHKTKTVWLCREFVEKIYFQLNYVEKLLT